MSVSPPESQWKSFFCSVLQRKVSFRFRVELVLLAVRVECGEGAQGQKFFLLISWLITAVLN